jgi:hypothetical protein
VPPPGPGVVTSTGRVPGAANTVAGIVAVSTAGFQYDVGSAMPANSTTAPLANPDPLTVNFVFPLPKGITAGEMEDTTGCGFTIVTVADADCAEFDTLVAVTVTVLGDGRFVGAMYRPVLLMTPAVLFPPDDPFTDHATPPLLPFTVAVNWVCPRRATCAIDGLRETVTAAGAFGCDAVVAFPPQSSMKVALKRIDTTANQHAILTGFREFKLRLRSTDLPIGLIADSSKWVIRLDNFCLLRKNGKLP